MNATVQYYQMQIRFEVALSDLGQCQPLSVELHNCCRISNSHIARNAIKPLSTSWLGTTAPICLPWRIIMLVRRSNLLISLDTERMGGADQVSALSL